MLCFVVLNTVEVSDQPFRVILKTVIRFITREMPPKASCCCLHHGRWGHSDFTDLRTASEPELKFCEVDKDGRHKGRKRKICTSCRNHIQLKVKCDKLEVGSCFCRLLVTQANVSWLSRDKHATRRYCRALLMVCLFCSPTEYSITLS